MPFLTVDGDRIHYTEVGASDPPAPTMLFVHGSCGSSGQWMRLASALAPEFRTICIDLPGMGASEPYPITRKWTLATDQRAVTALIDHLDRPLHFVSHSAGCVLSWKALRARADRILSCCLCEPVFFGLLRDAGHPKFGFVEQLRARILRFGDLADLEGMLEFFVDQWAGAPGVWAALPEKVRSSMRPGAGRLYHECREFPEFEREPLSPPIAPTLLIEGAETHPAMIALHDLLETRWPEAPRQRVPGAGQMAPFTHAEQLAPVIHRFALAAGPADG